MTAGDLVRIGAAVVLVLLASGLACMETALSRISRVRVEELVREQASGAVRLQRVLTDPARYLNLLLLLRLAFELLATAAVTLVCVDVLGVGWRALLLAAAVMTLISYVFIGVAPRTIGRQRADAVGLRTAGVAIALTRVFGPLPQLLILLGNALTPGRGYREGPFASEAELRDLVDLAEERQVIEHDEREMIHGVFELGDTIVREVMVPRPDIVFIERGKTVRQALALALRSGFSRIPVTGDSADDVVGVAYLKDLVRRTVDRGGAGGSGGYGSGAAEERVEDAMRPPVFVPESKPVDVLLREMQAERIHVAIVIDEYGGTAGLVTIEDILEEIVGEITDEYDREAPPVEQLDDDTWRVTARLNVEDLNGLVGVDLPSEDVETVGGLLASELGRVPIPGASVTVQGLTLTAESAAGRRNRIGTVLVHRVPEPGEGDADSPADTAA